MKKCQRCPKQASVHITEVLTTGGYEEIHLCEDCSRKHLHAAAGPGKKGAAGTVGAAGGTAADADEPGGKACPTCGLKFVEFRNAGRFGCPHDYDVFREELAQLLESIHGGIKHEGKVPRGSPKPKAPQAELSNLKRKLQQAVSDEHYEEAAQLRDRIRQLEEAT